MDIEVLGDVIDDAAPPPVMDTILGWIGFEQEATRTRIREEGFDTFADLATMKEKDIRDLAESYSRRTVADGRSIFGLRRIRYMIGLIHWVQDFGRTGEEASINGINNAIQFRAALDEASQRADVRKIEKDQSDTVSKAADPGKFKDERKWPEWEPAFANYLSTIQGVNGIPLSYVIRETEVPDRTIEYTNFNEKAIACVPLSGSNFQADARKVHQLLKSFLQTETAEQWIKSIARSQDGREDMIALRNHYSGEGTTTRRIAQAENFREFLHYKDEKSMSFSSFLDKIQKMFNLFEEEGEAVTEQAKVRMLLKKVLHPALSNAVSALRIRAQLDSVSFTECANHLAAMVSELPEKHLARKVSATDSKPKVKRIRGGGSNAGAASKRKGIHMPDGSIWTGYYSDWDKMSDTDKDTVMATRKTNKTKKGISGTPTKRKVADVKTQIADLKRTVAALKLARAARDDDTSATDDSSVPDNAGDAFGGRTSKKRKE